MVEKWVIRITGTRRALGEAVDAWQVAAFLLWYDPDSQTFFGWTQDAKAAKHYPSQEVAMADAARIAMHRTVGDDGEPNRPLLDKHTIEIMRLQDALGGNGGGK